MPLLTRTDAKDLSRRLHEARVDPAYQCDAPFTDPATGKPYRLVFKPKGRPDVLRKYGFECVDENGVPWDEAVAAHAKGAGQATSPGGVLVARGEPPRLHVRVPLGVHGADHLGVDPESGVIVCTLCHQDAEGG